MITRLIRSEITRLIHRRRVVIALLGFLAFSVVSPVTWTESARPHTPQEIAQARIDLASVGRECPDCTIESFMRTVWTLEETVLYGMAPVAFLLCAIVLLTVVVYSGSDFASGVIATQLTFTPQRSAVVLARALVASVYGGLLMLLSLGVTSAVTIIWYVAMHGYETIGNTTKLLDLFIWGTLFGVLLGFAATLMVVLFNGTTAAAAGILALILGSILIEALGPTVVPIQVFHLSPLRQMSALIDGVTEIYGGSNWDELLLSIGRGESLLYFVVALVLLTAITLAVFERRDIRS